MNPQFKKGVLEMIVLVAVSKKDMYGYELVAEVSQVVDVNEGTIYPLLKRLTNEHYFETYLRESTEGPPRKYYHLTAAGVHMVLFTTGRGTPVGAPVPTVKVATNENLAKKKANWIDFDASPTLSGNPLTEEFLDYIIDVASGKETTNEINDYREISIFKDGIVL